MNSRDDYKIENSSIYKKGNKTHNYRLNNATLASQTESYHFSRFSSEKPSESIGTAEVAPLHAPKSKVN